MTADVTPATWVVEAGRGAGHPGDPLNVPPVPMSNMVLDGTHGYVRNDSSPTWEALEEVVGGLEGGRALSWASGMAAVAAVMDLVPAGGTVVLPDDLYMGSLTLARHHEALGRLHVRQVDLTDVDAWGEAMQDADLVWLESPSNPLVTVADLPAICALPRPDRCVVAVDNTFATPLGQRPLELGADVVMHSGTKFIGGHSDLLMGLTVTRDDRLHDHLAGVRAHGGATPGVMEAWLATRGLRTLHVRFERAVANAQRIAEWLEADDRVGRVRFPGLPSHDTYDVASRTLDLPGAVLSFDLADAAAADAACAAVRLITNATSLGGVESCMERRGVYAGQDHLPPGLIRLSVGIEDADDLIADLHQAIPSPS